MPDLLHQVINYVHSLPSFIKSVLLTAAVAIEYIFPVFPGDTVVIFAGFLNAVDAMQMMQTAISIIAGTIIGSLLAYTIGRLIIAYGETVPMIAHITRSDGYRKFALWYKKWGGWFLLFNRFFPGIRALFFLAAGAEKIPLAQVLILGGLSAVIYNACLVLVGFMVGFNVEGILAWFYRFNAAAIIILFILIALIFYWAWSKRKK